MKRLLLLALLPALLTAQIKYFVSGGTMVSSASSTSGTESPLAHYWSNGAALAIGMEKRILPTIDFRATLGYAYLPYKSYGEQQPPREAMSVGLADPAAYTLVAADGDASSVVRLMIEGVYSEPLSGPLELLLSTGVGATMGSVGNIRATWMSNSGMTTRYTLRFSESVYLVHSAGLGLRYSLVGGIAVETAVKYYSNYTDRMQYSFMVGALVQ
ncbi:MAG: hypothetical protein HUU02_05575 [Bacteroidetes bacterium]|nr:hypothetical protein [Bacteroidota bacterium]